MFVRWLCAILLLPGTVLVLVPVGLLNVVRMAGVAANDARADSVRFWLAGALGTLGLGLSLWTMSLFWRFGNGTPAPWDPPQKLVVRGPYRHVRNPMIVGVMLMLAAETLYFGSWWLGAWTVAFGLGNAVYFPLVEEPGLMRRFGNDYNIYAANVGRWVPRWIPWTPPAANGAEHLDTKAAP